MISLLVVEARKIQFRVPPGANRKSRAVFYDFQKKLEGFLHVFFRSPENNQKSATNCFGGTHKANPKTEKAKQLLQNVAACFIASCLHSWAGRVQKQFRFKTHLLQHPPLGAKQIETITSSLPRIGNMDEQVATELPSRTAHMIQWTCQLTFQMQALIKWSLRFQCQGVSYWN